MAVHRAARYIHTENIFDKFDIFNIRLLLVIQAHKIDSQSNYAVTFNTGI